MLTCLYYVYFNIVDLMFVIVFFMLQGNVLCNFDESMGNLNTDYVVLFTIVIIIVIIKKNVLSRTEVIAASCITVRGWTFEIVTIVF